MSCRRPGEQVLRPGLHFIRQAQIQLARGRTRNQRLSFRGASHPSFGIWSDMPLERDAAFVTRLRPAQLIRTRTSAFALLPEH
jgi:hypothetical protein